VVRRVESVVMGLVLAILVVGVSVMVLSAPWFTRLASSRYSQWASAGLSRSQMADLAQTVRGFVVDGEGELPARIGSREAFDPSAVSHLADVADVLAMARVATGFAAAIVAVWVAVCVWRKRWAQLGAGLRFGAAFALVAVGIAALAGTMDFDAFFSAFHGVFFAAGTWTFASDSLLIQLFPEPFWVAAAGSWAAVVVVLAAVMWLLGRTAGRAVEQPRA